MTQIQKYIAITLVPTLILGYALGRYWSPTKVVVTDRLQAIEKQVVVKQVDTDAVIKAVQSAARDIDIHRTQTRTKLPDGTVTEVTTEDKRARETTNSSTSSDTKSHEAEVATKERVVVQEHLVERLVLQRPDWMVGIQAGVSLPRLLGQTEFIYQVPGLSLGALVVGLDVDRRILGPVYGGVWANNQGSMGLELRALW